MPLRLAVKVKLQKRSERVKWIDVHPQEPWILTALYSGRLFIWNYETETLVKSFDVVEQTPVRSAKFVARNQWFVCGADDNHIRCYNYNTSELVKAFEAHTDYIRCVEVHPSLPYCLSSSDDMSIKLWNWDKNWDLMQVFEGHLHYVMQVKFNPKDSNTFASASLDRTIKVWGIGAATPHFTLQGHDKGVNCIDYYPGADKPYLLSGADDSKVKVWDYQTKACVATLESGVKGGEESSGGGSVGGHTANVSAVAFHPKLPVIISASEDNTVRVWHSTTYRLESTLNYRLERAWTVAVSANSQKVAIGFDEGAVVLKLGKESPIVSMDSKSGKFIWVRNNEILTASVRGSGKTATDGEPVRLSGEKDLGTCELYPQNVYHNSNGRFVSVCGDGEYIVYTAGVLRNKCFGSAIDFGWSSSGTGDYAIRDTDLNVKIFKQFKDTGITFKPTEIDAEQLWGGSLIAIKSNDAVAFYDWETGYYIQRIDVPSTPKAIYWNDSGDKVIIATREAFYHLNFRRDVVDEHFDQHGNSSEDGVEEAFILEAEIQEVVRSGQWVGDCFLYVSKSGRLNYSVGGQTMTLSHLDRKMYMLGYVGRENRVYLCDKQMNVTSYVLLTSILEYQTWVLRGNFEEANTILNSGSIPKEENNKISRFLESQGYREEALEVANDPEQKFSLALQLRKLDVARDIMSEFSSSATESPDDIQFKWKQLGDLALMCGEMELSKDCAEKANDLSGLLLMYSSYGDRESMTKLVTQARKVGKFNVAFVASYILGDVHQCVDMLLDIGRVPEAALFARTYVPSRISEVVQIWKKELSNISEVLAQSLADPTDHPEGFPNLELSLQAEDIYKNAFAKRGPNSNNYMACVEERNNLMNENGEIDILAILQKGESLISGPGFGGTASTRAPAIAETTAVAEEVQEVVQEVVQEEVVVEEDVKEEDVVVAAEVEKETVVVEDNDVDDDLLNDDDDDLLDSEDDAFIEAPPAPVAAPAVVAAAPEVADEPSVDMDDDDLDDLLGSDEDDDDAGKDDEDIDLDDLDLDDDDEWS